MSDADASNTFTVSHADLHPEEEFGEFSAQDAKIVRALACYARTLHIGKSCRAAGVNLSTWYYWKKTIPRFGPICEEIRLRCVDQVEDSLIRHGKRGNVEAAKAVLKAHNPKYREKQVIEVVSPDVQLRLVRQSDVYIQTLKAELPPDVANRIIGLLAERLAVVWTTGGVPALPAGEATS